MSGITSIEWATRSWNPTTGCKRVSDGCDNCYAFRLHDQRHVAWKRGRMPSAAPQYHIPYSKPQLFPARLQDPASWQEPSLVFVDSMADLFWDEIPVAFISKVFNTMESVDRHIYQLLTKRPERMAKYVLERYRGRRAPEHIWLGTSVEDMTVVDRVDRLRETPARIRFLSCEPLLGSLKSLDLTGVHWVIAGGESGPRRRPIDGMWVRELREICTDTGTAFFFKQWGGVTPKAGGRELDGRTWDQYPRVALRPSPSARRARAEMQRAGRANSTIFLPRRPAAQAIA